MKPPHSNRMHRAGFTLVELSIVLVIVGLITGGILAGQSLIKASQLKAIASEYRKYSAALNNFRTEYNAIPGDMKNASRYWGYQNAGTGCVTNSGAAADTVKGVCDGDGNGLTGYTANASQSSESFQFWRHLVAAGLIEGTYTGIAGPAAGGGDAIVGTNIPESKFPQGAWSFQYSGTLDGSVGTDFTAQFDNYFIYGGKLANSLNYAQILTAQETWEIDTKLDDGLPGTGIMLAHPRNGNCATATSATDYTAQYNVGTTGVACKFYLIRQ